MLIHAVKWFNLHAVCKTIIFPVEPVLKQYGGVGALAKALGYDYQRVHNWISRGIPSLEVALRPDIFAAARTGAGNAAPDPHKEAA